MQTQQRLIEPLSTRDAAELFVVHSSELEFAWPMIRRFLGRVEDPEWTFDEVHDALRDCEAQAWGLRNKNEVLGIWITKLLETKKHKYGLVWICAGRGLDLGLTFYPHIENWFKEKGCEYVEIHGRHGWKKVMPDYEVKHIVLRKKL